MKAFKNCLNAFFGILGGLVGLPPGLIPLGLPPFGLPPATYSSSFFCDPCLSVATLYLQQIYLSV